MKYDVFVSYASPDKDIALSVRATLLKSGLNVWLADTNIKSGARWKRDIEKAIENSASLVVILSKSAKSSEWVSNELDYARLHGTEIFPILALDDEKSAIPVDLPGRQYVDIRTDYDQIEELVETLHQYVQDLKIPIPIQGAIAAGKPVPSYEDTHEYDDVLVSASLLNHIDKAEVYAAHVYGDSMVNKGIYDGSIVLIQSAESVQNGDVAVVRMRSNDETTLKTYYREGSQIRLEPANDDYEVIYRHPIECLIQGKFMAVIE